VSLCVQISGLVFPTMVTVEEARRLLSCRVNRLLLTWEDSDGNHIDHSSCFVFIRRWRLGLLPLAQELGPSAVRGSARALG
jgi:hypothetical protein